MYTHTEINVITERISKMENYFDIIQESLHNTTDLLDSKSAVSVMLEELIDYYENGQWFKDYQCDETGILPENLKRGVLSEDGVYNLICEVMEYREICDT